MKSKFLLPAILFAGLMFINFSMSQVYGQVPQDKVVKMKTAKYTCPMHPEVAKDQPGNCPKCGEKLVLKKDIQGKVAPKAQKQVAPELQEPVIEKKTTKVPKAKTVKKEPEKP